MQEFQVAGVPPMAERYLRQVRGVSAGGYCMDTWWPVKGQRGRAESSRTAQEGVSVSRAVFVAVQQLFQATDRAEMAPQPCRKH